MMPVFSTRIAAFSLMLLMLFTTARYLFFNSCMAERKAAFRIAALVKHRGAVTAIKMNTADLFRDIEGIEWKENSREIVISGRFHEVLKIERMGLTSIVYTIEDTKESHLFAMSLDSDIAGNTLIVFLKDLTFPPLADGELRLQSHGCFHGRQGNEKICPGHMGALLKPPSDSPFPRS
jgi:hypothetical protein